MVTGSSCAVSDMAPASLMIKTSQCLFYGADISITCRDKQIQPISLTLCESHVSAKHPQVVAGCMAGPRLPLRLRS